MNNLKNLHSQKVSQYFEMRKTLSVVSDKERQAMERKSGKLFAEIVELGAKAYPSVHYSNS